jgi:hypothetical protein
MATYRAPMPSRRDDADPALAPTTLRLPWRPASGGAGATSSASGQRGSEPVQLAICLPWRRALAMGHPTQSGPAVLNTSEYSSSARTTLSVARTVSTLMSAATLRLSARAASSVQKVSLMV